VTKNRIISLSLAVIFIILASISYIEKLEEKNNQLVNVNTALNDSITYRKNKYNQLYAEKQVVEVTKEVAEKVYKKRLKEYRDLLNAKNVTSGTEIGIQTIGQGTVILRDTIVDTVYFRSGKLTIDERWFTFNALIKEDSANYDYKVIDSLSIVTDIDKRFFKPDVHYIKAINHNPKTKVTGLNHVTIVESKKTFSAGPAILYDPFSNSFRVGLSIQYSVLSF
jgi:hypothetical protein